MRSLSTEEIVAQPVHLLEGIERDYGVKAADITRLQIMTMAMGEPLLNQERLVGALYTLHDLYPHAALLVSTSGPKVSYDKFIAAAVEIPTVGLQFSIHESTEAARNLLIPFKSKLSLEEIASEGQRFFDSTGRRPFFNYCVHEKNNTDQDVARLTKLFTPTVWESTVSVICERDETLKAAHERQAELTEEFMGKMLTAGYSTRKFDPAGQDDIGGGCGQLFYAQNWFKENPDKAKPSAGCGKPIHHMPS